MVIGARQMCGVTISGGWIADHAFRFARRQVGALRRTSTLETPVTWPPVLYA
jgi:hypothetical protein